VVGPLMYAILPGCGPIYAFGKQWLHPPDVPAETIKLAGLPNAFPSLHVGTAFVLVLLAPGRFWKAIALLFLAGTCMATLATGEHFVIDLIPGLAFGAFAASIGLQNYRRAAAYLSLTLAWSLSVRFGYSLLIGHPLVTRIFAVATVALAFLALRLSWSEAAQPDEGVGAMVESSKPAPALTV
jgi:hypothetical protein